MAGRNLRYDGAHIDPSTRIAAGVSVASSCQAIQVALIRVLGRGLASRVTIAAARATAIEEPLAARLRKLVAAPGHDVSVSLQTLGEVGAELAVAAAEAIGRLVAEAGIPPGKVLVVGVDDPGLWSAGGTTPCCFPLCGAARLAERSGMSVVDDFPARDLAQGGQGGPLGAVAQWILLKDAHEDRILVDLGRTTRLSVLPADCHPMASSRILSFDVGPGTWLLDELASRLTGSRERFDAGGRLAVQGRRIDALLAHWLADHAVTRTLPRWHPRGIRPDRLLGDAMRMAVESRWSVQDMLCTATHLIAESASRAVRERLPDGLRAGRLVITGGGQHNGMLLREIAARLDGMRMSRAAELGVADNALQPASAALLAIFHLDQVPGNLPSVTGVEIPRVLGRLTPGSPQNWQRLLHQLTGEETAPRPLRSAL